MAGGMFCEVCKQAFAASVSSALPSSTGSRFLNKIRPWEGQRPSFLRLGKSVCLPCIAQDAAALYLDKQAAAVLSTHALLRRCFFINTHIFKRTPTKRCRGFVPWLLTIFFSLSCQRMVQKEPRLCYNSKIWVSIPIARCRKGEIQ